MKIIYVVLFCSIINQGHAGTLSKINSDSLVNRLQKSISLNSDLWFAKDKAMHFTGSFISTGLLTNSFHRFSNKNRRNSLSLSVSLTFPLGVFKEIYDSRQKNNIFSLKDLTANLAGIALAILVFK